jgi:hypothetical protein
MRILFDTNVVLDVVLERKPFSVPAGQLFDAADRKMLTGLLTPTTLGGEFGNFLCDNGSIGAFNLQPVSS